VQVQNGSLGTLDIISCDIDMAIFGIFKDEVICVPFIRIAVG